MYLTFKATHPSAYIYLQMKPHFELLPVSNLEKPPHYPTEMKKEKEREHPHGGGKKRPVQIYLMQKKACQLFGVFLII